MSIFDWVTSIGIYILIGLYILRLQGLLSWSIFFVFWVVLGIVIHLLFRIPTKLGFCLGLNSDPQALLEGVAGS